MITIKDISTRELLIALRISSQSCCYDFETVMDSEHKILVGSRLTTGGNYQTVYATKKDILDELSTRPHISNKKESKVIRRLMAKTGHSEEWLRQHSKYGQEIADAQYPNRRIVSSDWAKQYSERFGSMFGKLFKVI